MDAHYGGLLAQVPFTVTYLPPGVESITMLLVTTDVEVYRNDAGEELVHNVYLDWEPGTRLPEPTGTINDQEQIPAHPEVHVLTIPTEAMRREKHTLTIIVNPEVQAGNRDDFVLKRIEMDDQAGARIGW